jgi:hypothetical protein
MQVVLDGVERSNCQRGSGAKSVKNFLILSLASSFEDDNGDGRRDLHVSEERQNVAFTSMR